MEIRNKIIFITIGFLISFSLLLYPFASNIYNQKVNESLIADYEENLSEISDEENDAEFQKALDYNQNIGNYSYDELLNLQGDSIMGYISIPSINVYLPIYHYTSDEVLENGVGHLETSSLPVGGTSTRSILTGHRGLPGSKLFTDLDQLEIGDIFYLKILDNVLTYEVTEIEVIEPSELEALEIEYGKDLCTLVTCTPYGINTHRLLVTGARVKDSDTTIDTADFSQENKADPFSLDMLLVYIAVAELILYIVIIIRLLRQKKQESAYA